MRFIPTPPSDSNQRGFWRWLAGGVGTLLVVSLIARVTMPFAPIILLIGIPLGLIVGAVAVVVAATRGTRRKKELDATVARLDAAAKARPDAVARALARRAENTQSP
jgi:hypothetical protein